jgi:hypothetical protein
MNTATLAVERNISGGLDDLLTFVGVPSKRSARELSGSAEELFKGIKTVLDTMLLRAIEARTGAEFVVTRDDVFVDYYKTVSALSNLARVIVPARVLDRLVVESFSELEADLRDKGLARFGAVARDQAVFTVWTLRKTNRLISIIAAAGKVPEDLRAQDKELAFDFSIASRVTQFHLDCLIASMHFDKAINPEVLTEICDGLRTAVNAYGLIRQGVDLRVTREEPVVAPYEWDEEDKELLASSMSDMEAEDL